MDDTDIKSVADFCGWLRGLKSKKGFVYRGQSDCARQNSCSAYRRLANHSSEKIEPQLIDPLLVVYLKLLIGKSKMRGFIPPGLNDTCADLEILAHMQHHGAATGLIDFTTQPLVALWFACDKSSETDGAIYALPRSDAEEVREKDDLEDGIKKFYDRDKPSLWQPSAIGGRIIAQGSVFLFGVPIIKSPNMKKLVIKGNNKKAIKKELEVVHGINEEALFSDFSGYAVANAPNKDFDVRRTIDYLERQIEHATGNDKKVEVHFNCGVAYSAIREHGQAIKQYDKVIMIDPEYAEAYINRGIAKSNLEKFDEAIRDFDKATELDPRYAEAYINRGIAKMGQEKYDEAIEDYDRAIDIDSGYAYAYNNRGIAKDNLGRYDEAIEDYDKAIDIDSGYAIAYNNRGIAKDNLGRYDEAIEDYDRAIDIDSEYVSAYINRSIAKRNIKRYNDAIEDCDRAIKINSKTYAAIYNRGICWACLSDWDKAKKDLISVRDKGITIADDFRLLEKDISNLEKKHDNQLPDDIKALLISGEDETK